MSVPLRAMRPWVGWMAIVCHAEVLNSKSCKPIPVKQQLPKRQPPDHLDLLHTPKLRFGEANTQWQPGTTYCYHNLCRWIHFAKEVWFVLICWNARELETPMDFFVSSTAGKATRCSSARKNSLTGIGRMKLDESANQYNSQRWKILSRKIGGFWNPRTPFWKRLLSLSIINCYP